MKKTLKYMLLLTTVVGIMAGCKRDDDYIKSTPSNFIANLKQAQTAKLPEPTP